MEFLTVASSHVFMRHVSDLFISEIVDLNDTKFSSTDLEGEGIDNTFHSSQLFYYTMSSFLSK